MIKPIVLGKRIELIRTDNPYADLKPGDRGTVVDVSELSYEDKPLKVWVLWDSGSRLTISEGHDEYRNVYAFFLLLIFFLNSLDNSLISVKTSLFVCLGFGFSF